MFSKSLFFLVYFITSAVPIRTNSIQDTALQTYSCNVKCLEYGDIGQNECRQLCALELVCTGQHCQKFCPPSDARCSELCDEITSAATATCLTTKCSHSIVVDMSVAVSDVRDNRTFVSYTRPPSRLGLALLEQVSDTGNLTVDYVISSAGGIFTGLTPWNRYQLRFVELSVDTCCYQYYNSTDGSPMVIAVTATPLNLNYSNSYYNNALPSNLFLTYPDVGVNPDVVIHPGGLLYNGTWNILKQASASEVKILLKRAALGNKIYSTSSSGVPGNLPARLGTGFIVTVTKSYTQLYYRISENKFLQSSFNFKNQTFCMFLEANRTNKGSALAKTDCGVLKNDSDNLIQVTPSLNTSLRLFLCAKIQNYNNSLPHRQQVPPRKRSLSWQPCCSDNTSIECITTATSNENQHLILNKKYEYLLFNVFDEGSSCSIKSPCNGMYQRITAGDIEVCPTESPNTPENDKTLSLILGVSLSGTGILVLLLIYLGYRHIRNTPRGKDNGPQDQSSQLGGELSRDKIVKELFIAKGGHGFIFKGKLNIKYSTLNEAGLSMSQLLDVAIKILKTKLDDDLDESEKDNVREAKKAMKAEINVMKRLQNVSFLHRNVVQMYGYVIDTSPYILVLDLCITDLKRYLRGIRFQIDTYDVTAAELQAGAVEALTASTSKGTTRSEGRIIPSYQRSTTTVAFYNDSKKGKMEKHATNLEVFKDMVITRAQLLNYCWQIASGMDFIHSLDVLHCDLAADNVLVKLVDSNEVVLKICDFGQSRILYKGEYVSSGDSLADRQRKFRLRWTAPEIQKADQDRMWNKYCDVWSYGVVMWEVYTLGGFPYAGWPDYYVLSNIMSGHRMKKPQASTDDVWQIMSRCWNITANQRSTFSHIKEELELVSVEQQDAQQGIEKVDYIQCDTEPIVEEDISDIVIDIDIQDTDKDEGRLHIESVCDHGRELCNGEEDNLSQHSVGSKDSSSFNIQQSTVFANSVVKN